jgi:hypothetical protein
MGIVQEGGYVVTTVDSTLRHTVGINEKTLKKVAELLGIPKTELDQLSNITSISVFRGTKRPPKRGTKRSPKRG